MIDLNDKLRSLINYPGEARSATELGLVQFQIGIRRLKQIDQECIYLYIYIYTVHSTGIYLFELIRNDPLLESSSLSLSNIPVYEYHNE